LAVYNTTSDAANTAVRAVLTKVGEHYLGRSFNTGSGRGKEDWRRIRDIAFGGRCAYCDKADIVLQVEHLRMFNREEYGLHHPGNIVPCCKPCNKRTRLPDKSYANWVDHLHDICAENGESHRFERRHRKILDHMETEKYPKLNDKERHAIRVIANSLYENIKLEADKSLNMYKELDTAFVKG